MTLTFGSRRLLRTARAHHERYFGLDEARGSGALGKERRVAAEIGGPALALFVLGEIVAAGGEDRSGQPGAFGPEELGVRYVGGHVGGAGRMAHQIDAVRVGAEVR